MRFAVLALLVGGAPSVARGESKPKLAVMALEDATRSLSPSLVESLTDALRARLAQSGRFIVIDKSRQAEALRRLVKQQKRESYRACYDTRCQIPLGQAVSADTILRTKLTRVGSSYLMNAELVDLAKEAVTGGGQAQAAALPKGTRDDRLLTAVERVAELVSGGAGSGGGGAAGARAPEGGTGRGRDLSGPAPTEGAGEPDGVAAARSAEPAPPADTPEELARKQEERARRAEEQRRVQLVAAEEARRQEDLGQRARRRSAMLIYGYLALSTGVVFGATGAYYLAAKTAQEVNKAREAASPSELETAAGAAKSAQTTGWVLTGIGAASAGIGLWLILAAPRVERPVTVGRFRLDRLPSATAASSGVALRWGGRF
ncbi:MAG: hypothetical protein IT371_16190 [Deltaproteobacteria bacterium]|nr:hypothetical protein [Deltaproteobacteria bacterium]